jgi:DNA-binding transcriptional MocR family regulator
MFNAINMYLIPLGVSMTTSEKMAGGYFMWFSLPQPLLAVQVAANAQEAANLIVAHGNLFEVYGDEKSAKFDNQIRVCFAWESEDNLEEGIRRLGRVIQQMKAAADEKPSSNGTANSTLQSIDTHK